MQRRSRKITYSALTAAIAVCCMLISQLVLLKSLLFVCSICFYIALDRCGLLFGILSIISSIMLTLLMGFLGTAVLVALIFAPYGVIHYFARHLKYNKPLHIVVRIIISVVFANLVALLAYHLASLILPDVDLDRILKFFGGYFFLAAFITLFFIVTDFFFVEFCKMFTRLLR